MTIVDRRQTKNRSIENREKFKARHQDVIQDAVADAIKNIDIKDVLDKKDRKVKIPITEEEYRLVSTNDTIDDICTGNETYRNGDKIKKSQGASGVGKAGGNTGEGMDPFEFNLTAEEFEEYLFKNLSLPNMVEKDSKIIVETVKKHDGFKTHGIPAKLSIIRSVINSIGRRLAMIAGYTAAIKQEKEKDPLDKEKIEELERLKNNIPFLNEVDLRYKHEKLEHKTTTAGVMICLMDVSGSMGEEHKYLAKMFYILLLLFLRRNYDKFEMRFITYHSIAKEVSSEEFFKQRETGGTVISNALKLAKNMIEKDYNPSEYNVYVCHAGDGGNFEYDCPTAVDIFKTQLFPALNLFINLNVWPGCSGFNAVYNKSSMAYFDRYMTEQERTGNEKIKTGTLLSKDNVYPEFVRVFRNKP